jgi:hypothetical protein
MEFRQALALGPPFVLFKGVLVGRGGRRGAGGRGGLAEEQVVCEEGVVLEGVVLGKLHGFDILNYI